MKDKYENIRKKFEKNNLRINNKKIKELEQKAKKQKISFKKIIDKELKKREKIRERKLFYKKIQEKFNKRLFRITNNKIKQFERKAKKEKKNINYIVNKELKKRERNRIKYLIKKYNLTEDRAREIIKQRIKTKKSYKKILGIKKEKYIEFEEIRNFIEISEIIYDKANIILYLKFDSEFGSWDLHGDEVKNKFIEISKAFNDYYTDTQLENHYWRVQAVFNTKIKILPGRPEIYEFIIEQITFYDNKEKKFLDNTGEELWQDLILL